MSDFKLIGKEGMVGYGHWMFISNMYHIIVQIPTHSVINIDMVDNLSQTGVVTLQFPGPEILFADMSLSCFVELMSTENVPSLLLHYRMKTICMKCQIQFSQRNVILSSAELAHRVVKVTITSISMIPA